HPNLHARHLAGGKSRTIGMIVSNMENPFFFDIYKTVESDAHAAGFEVVVANTDYRSEQLVSSIRLMIGRRVAGLAAVVSEMEPALIEAVANYPGLEVRTAADADTLDGGRLAVRALLASGEQPTAIVCVNDIMAVGALRELRERGIGVPRDVSVTGFDNVKLSEFCYPALTTVHIPRDTIGHLICESLLAKSDKATVADHEMVIDPEFVLRDSTGPVPGRS